MPQILSKIIAPPILKDKGESLEDDKRTLVDLLVEQIEFANVILLNKIDLISSQELKTVKAIITGLNTEAKVFECSHSTVNLKEVIGTGLFDLKQAHTHPLWAKELYNFKNHVPETEEYGITSFVYLAREPFDPSKIHNFFNQEWPGVIRSKGFFGFQVDLNLLVKFLRQVHLFVIKELVGGGRLYLKIVGQKDLILMR